MNLNKNNFSEIYPLIATQIKECDLVAFDLEYSGIKLADQSGYSLFDTIEDRYQHIKSCSQSFTTFQLGIVLYTRRINDKTILLNNCSKFSSATYNINLFPTGSDLFDSTFTCSASALKFLRNHSMDFNDIIDNGVGFLNNKEFLQLKTKLDSYSNVNNVLTEDHERYLEIQRKTIGEWLNNLKPSQSNDETCQIVLPRIDGLSSYFHQMFLRSHFVNISTTSTTDQKILIERITLEKRNEIDQQEVDLCPTSEKYKFCMDMLGVSKIWRLISRLKKPVVGHNCLFDLITIYQKFHAPLPETFDEFRLEMNRFLPVIYDTKFIFGRMRMNFKQLSEITGGLESVYKSLYQMNQDSKNGGVNIEEMVAYDNNKPCEEGINKIRTCQAHEAGYDSFMTGSCLIYLANILYKSQLPNNNNEQQEQENIIKDMNNSYDKTPKKSGIISVASFETYESYLKRWRNYVNVIRAHEFCICFDKLIVDDGYRTMTGNKLNNTRPPWLIIYDRNPTNELLLLPIQDDVIIIDETNNNIEEEEDNNNIALRSIGETYFSQAFLEQLLFEFGDANIKKFGKIVDDERYQKFMVALPSYNITRSFLKSIKKRWPRLVVREYNRFRDDPFSKRCLIGVTSISTVVSAWCTYSLIKELQSFII